MLRSLREGIDYSTPVGRMVAGIFAALAEYERTLINERAAAAREAARLRGRPVGRKRAMTDGQLEQARILRSYGPGSGGGVRDVEGLAGDSVPVT